MSRQPHFARIEFTETIGYGNPDSVLALNLVEKEISYQVFHWKRLMPAIQGFKTEILAGREFSWDVSSPARAIRNEKTGFKPRLIKCDNWEPEVIFSYGRKLSNEEFEKICSLCVVDDYLPFCGRIMSMDDKGYVGYRDEVRLQFCGITDSYIPMIQFRMSYFYDEAHIWPSERLYRHLITSIFDHDKTLKGWYTSYGGHSLFC